MLGSIIEDIRGLLDVFLFQKGFQKGPEKYGSLSVLSRTPSVHLSTIIMQFGRPCRNHIPASYVIPTGPLLRKKMSALKTQKLLIRSKNTIFAQEQNLTNFKRK